MVKSTQFYCNSSDTGMILRNGKKINCLLSTTLYRCIKEINEYHNKNYNYRDKTKLKMFKKEDCSSVCSMINKFLYFVVNYYNEISCYPKLNLIYKLSTNKIKEFIKEIEDNAIKGRCNCSEIYLKELKNIYLLYNQPPKYQKELYFKLASVMNQDIAMKIINYL